jgi:AcrR family transcriptional regulator
MRREIAARRSASADVPRGHPPEFECRGAGCHDRVLRGEVAQCLLVIGLDNREAVGVVVSEDRPEHHHVATFEVRARDAASGDGDDAAARLLARCRAYVGFALANPGPYRYLFSQHAPTGDPARGPVDLPVFQALAESISRCQQAGLARAGDDPRWLAAQVWAALHGLVLLRLNAPGFPWPGPLEQMADQAAARLIGLDIPAGKHSA